jgi:hypothetical protein
MKYRLKKDIVIPAGTIFDDASDEKVRYGDGVIHYTVGLTKNSFGDFLYALDGEEQEDGSLNLMPELKKWFERIDQ